MKKLKPTTDLWGKPIVPVPKCGLCGKPKNNHNAVTKMCPKGPKYRTMGYLSYGPTVFTPKTKKE